MLSPSDVLPLRVADLTFPEAHPLAGQHGVVMAHAIRHPQGIVLFDTGIGRDNPRLDEAYRVVHRSLEQELAAHSIALDEIAAVVNSHLHFDHCGSNKLFPETPNLCSGEGVRRFVFARLYTSTVGGFRRRSL